MDNFVKLTKEFKQIESFMQQLNDASLDILEFEDAVVSAKLIIDIDTKKEIEDDSDKMSADMSPEDLLEKMLNKSKSKKEIRTKTHKIELDKMSHIMSLALMTYLIDKMKESKESIANKVNKIDLK
tara:strand:+ start:2063 stop:2440 length:378 start_codon:yes stop_codon:yes gene_type:complete